MKYSPEIWICKKTISLKEYYYGCLSIQLEYVCDDVSAYVFSIYLLPISLSLYNTIHMEIHSLLAKKRNRSSFFLRIFFFMIRSLILSGAYCWAHSYFLLICSKKIFVVFLSLLSVLPCYGMPYYTQEKV